MINIKAGAHLPLVTGLRACWFSVIFFTALASIQSHRCHIQIYTNKIEILSIGRQTPSGKTVFRTVAVLPFSSDTVDIFSGFQAEAERHIYRRHKEHKKDIQSRTDSGDISLLAPQHKKRGCEYPETGKGRAPICRRPQPVRRKFKDESNQKSAEYSGNRCQKKMRRTPAKQRSAANRACFSFFRTALSHGSFSF